MSLDDIRDAASDGSARTKLIGIYVGILAVLLALTGMGSGNATKDMMRANIDASNTWGFFQARVIRRTVLELSANELELALTARPELEAEQRALFLKSISTFRETAKLYTSNPKTQDGADELFAKARALEQERDLAMRRDPYFDYAQALLQIAIVLASIAIISGGNGLLYASAALGGVGALLMANGFLLLVRVPGLG